MSQELLGRVALVTGGATGIGKSTAAELAARGAQVVIAGRDRERGKAIAKTLAEAGTKVRFVQADVRVEEEVKNLIRQTAESFGRLDYLFNNAGIEGPLCPIIQWSTEACDQVLGVNIKGVFLGLKHAIPVMIEQGGGVIVNTASFVGVVMPIPDSILYGASKAAVLSLTTATAVAYADQGICVYAVCPWVTDTPMIDRVSGHQTEVRNQLAKLNPSGQIALPEDVANVAVAMFAGTSGYKSGDAVLVDSGGATRRVSLQLS
jgi:NAD(P)-dependent dehydrogenase (short-subunit alcohol dehydrogenase family)